MEWNKRKLLYNKVLFITRIRLRFNTILIYLYHNKAISKSSLLRGLKTRHQEIHLFSSTHHSTPWIYLKRSGFLTMFTFTFNEQLYQLEVINVREIKDIRWYVLELENLYTEIALPGLHINLFWTGYYQENSRWSPAAVNTACWRGSRTRSFAFAVNAQARSEAHPVFSALLEGEGEEGRSFFPRRTFLPGQIGNRRTP